MQYKIKRMWIHKNKRELQTWQDFLVAQGIGWEINVTYTVGVFDSDRLIATGSLFQNIIKCIAVSQEYQGGQVISLLISHLLGEVMTGENTACYVYTKPESLDSFIHLGFEEIARVGTELVFLEKALSGFPSYLENLEKQVVTGAEVAAIVMNANPFTKGHQYLIEYAATREDILHIFVLSEELSVFPSKTRLQLVKEGTKHLKNVHVHVTGDYMVSAKTFPSYFLKEDVNITKLQAKLDATIFRKIATAMNIKKRYVGEEPYSQSTAIYNEAMAQVFAGFIELIIIPRKEEGGEVISASRVRKLLSENKVEETSRMVPSTTFDFFTTVAGKNIINKLQGKEGS